MKTPSTTTTLRAERTGEDVLADLEAAWRRSDELFDLLPESGLDLQPIDLRHPLIFYLGHLPAFAWNQLCRGVLGRESFRPDFDDLFEFGIDPDEVDEREAVASWPSVREILEYRDRIRDEIRKTPAALRARAADDVLAERARALHLVLEHELMHHETLLYMLQRVDVAKKRRPNWWKSASVGEPRRPKRRVAIPEGTARLGVAFDEPDFGWDNEFPAREVDVPAFRIDESPVTLADYVEFVDAGGYDARELWDDDGWAWRERSDVHRPLDWIERAGDRFVRTMFEYVPLELATGWPVSATYAEAAAYARWRGARLPSEPELMRAAYGSPDGAEPDAHDKDRPHPWGREAPTAKHANVGFVEGAPTPVGSHPAGASAFGVHDLVGDGWEWTSTPFLAHEGFTSWIESYAGYSRDFFDGRHNVLLGGSWATPTKLVRRSFRNWFRTTYPYPFTKFRLVRDD